MDYRRARDILVDMAYREEYYCIAPNIEVIQALRLGAEVLTREASKVEEAEEVQE